MTRCSVREFKALTISIACYRAPHANLWQFIQVVAATARCSQLANSQLTTHV